MSRRSSWVRPRRPLVRGVPVAALSLDDDDIGAGIAAWQREVDDARARELLALPFTWMRFLEWWCLRRWVAPDQPELDHLAPQLRHAPPEPATMRP